MNCQAKGTFDDLNWVKRCAFWYESGCKVVYRRRTSDGGLHIGEVSVCAHADHTKYTLQRGVPKHIKGLLTPSRLKMPPRQIKHWLRDSQGLEIDSNMAKRITTYRSRMLKLSDAQGLDGLDLSSAYGALAQLAEQNQYETLAVTDDFTLHTPYVFTSPALIDADRDLCLIGNTTEHLMLNLYRQATSGLPSFAGMDSTWKRVMEKHPSIPLGTADSAQRGHWVAWAIAYSEAENILYMYWISVFDHLKKVVIKHHGSKAWADLGLGDGYFLQYLMSDGAHAAKNALCAAQGTRRAPTVPGGDNDDTVTWQEFLEVGQIGDGVPTTTLQVTTTVAPSSEPVPAAVPAARLQFPIYDSEKTSISTSMDCWFHWARTIKRSITDRDSLATTKDFWPVISVKLNKMHANTDQCKHDLLMEKFVEECTKTEPTWTEGFFLKHRHDKAIFSLCQRPHGLPNTNNFLERGNRTEKEDSGYSMTTLVKYAQWQLKWLGNVSKDDEAFGGLSKIAWCGATFRKALALIETGLLDMVFKQQAKNGASSSWFILSNKYMEDVVGDTAVEKRASVKEWLKTHLALLKDPKHEASECTFDQLAAWSTTFYTVSYMKSGPLRDAMKAFFIQQCKNGVLPDGYSGDVSCDGMYLCLLQSLPVL